MIIIVCYKSNNNQNTIFHIIIEYGSLTISDDCHRGLAFCSIKTVNNDDVFFARIPTAVPECVLVSNINQFFSFSTAVKNVNV